MKKELITVLLIVFAGGLCFANETTTIEKYKMKIKALETEKLQLLKEKIELKNEVWTYKYGDPNKLTDFGKLKKENESLKKENDNLKAQVQILRKKTTEQEKLIKSQKKQANQNNKSKSKPAESGALSQIVPILENCLGKNINSIKYPFASSPEEDIHFKRTKFEFKQNATSVIKPIFDASVYKNIIYEVNLVFKNKPELSFKALQNKIKNTFEITEIVDNKGTSLENLEIAFDITLNNDLVCLILINKKASVSGLIELTCFHVETQSIWQKEWLKL